MGRDASDRVRLWTIQSVRAWEMLQRNGVLRADGRRISFSDFRPAYHWMMAQMRARVPGYGGRYLIWAWQHQQPDLRYAEHVPRGTRAVRLECMLPRDRVLLSDFDGWHFVLNRTPFTWNAREDRWWERRLAGVSYSALAPDLRAEVERTWERIFELRRPRGSRVWLGSLEVQATFEELSLHEVVRATPFVGR